MWRPQVNGFKYWKNSGNTDALLSEPFWQKVTKWWNSAKRSQSEEMNQNTNLRDGKAMVIGLVVSITSILINRLHNWGNYDWRTVCVIDTNEVKIM